MLDGLSAQAGRLRRLVQAILHRLQDLLVLPTRNAPVLAGRALCDSDTLKWPTSMV